MGIGFTDLGGSCQSYVPCIFDHNGGKGALIPCPLRLKLSFSSLYSHLTLSLVFCLFFFFFFTTLWTNFSCVHFYLCCSNIFFLLISHFSLTDFLFFNPKQNSNLILFQSSLNSYRPSRFRIRHKNFLQPYFNKRYYDIKWALDKSRSFIIQLCIIKFFF